MTVFANSCVSHARATVLVDPIHLAEHYEVVVVQQLDDHHDKMMVSNHYQMMKLALSWYVPAVS